ATSYTAAHSHARTRNPLVAVNLPCTVSCVAPDAIFVVFRVTSRFKCSWASKRAASAWRGVSRLSPTTREMATESIDRSLGVGWLTEAFTWHWVKAFIMLNKVYGQDSDLKLKKRIHDNLPRYS